MVGLNEPCTTQLQDYSVDEMYKIDPKVTCAIGRCVNDPALGIVCSKFCTNSNKMHFDRSIILVDLVGRLGRASLPY